MKMTGGDISTLVVVGWWVILFVLGYFAGWSYIPYAKRKEAQTAVKEAAQVLLTYYQSLPESQTKVHERDLVRKLSFFFDEEAGKIVEHEEGFRAITAMFKTFKELIQARHRGV